MHVLIVHNVSFLSLKLFITKGTIVYKFPFSVAYGDLWRLGMVPRLPQMCWSWEGWPSGVHHVEGQVQHIGLAARHQQVLGGDPLAGGQHI